MWAQYEKYKNHYLQMQLKHIKPQQINEMVEKENSKSRNMETCCYKEDCQSASYFEDRAQLAYGFWALPKLMKELNNDDFLTRWRAINSLSEYVVNPLYAQTALHQYDIVRRCQNLFLRIRIKYRKVKARETTGLLVIFYYLAMHKSGSYKIVEKYRLMDQFYTIIRKREKYAEATAKILPLLSARKRNRSVLINDYKVFDKLWDIWAEDPNACSYLDDLWMHLTHFLEIQPLEAMKKGFFDIFYTRIRNRFKNYHVWDMKCFGLLLRCQEGQQRFLGVDGVRFLYQILNEELLDNYENVVFALMHGLFAKSALWRCREFTNLPLIITKLAQDSCKNMQQLYCLQTLREMGVMPVIKRFMKENCLVDIQNLQCENPVNENERCELVYWLKREIYHTKNLKLHCLNPEENN